MIRADPSLKRCSKSRETADIYLSTPIKSQVSVTTGKKIESDIERIMKCKDWKLIVTHNKDGEYGHQHHKYTHSIVTELYKDNKLTSPLYCFGKYYSKAKLPDHEDKMTKMNDKQIEYKNDLVKVYESQSGTVDKLWHMSPYEMWTLYEAD